MSVDTFLHESGMRDVKWHIGCSGFHYKEWKGLFYPEKLPQRKWFEYYTGHFNTIELNVTFYRFPQLKSLEKWYTASEPGFRFSVKAPRLITHYKQFKDSESLLSDFYNTIQLGFREKLGAVLFQMPPGFAYSEERLELIGNSLKPDYKNVVEFRHESWWREQVYESLNEKGIIFSGISHPVLPDTPIVNGKTAYYRFHGRPRLYYSSYSIEELKNVADRLGATQSLKEVYIYFNNTAGSGALENANWLKNYLSV